MNQSDLIMSRVLFLHRLRRTWHSPWSKVALLSVFLTAELLLVSILEVVKNAWQARDFLNISRYLVSAFIQTDIAVQGLFVAFALVAGLLLRDIFQNLRSARSHRQLATL